MANKVNISAIDEYSKAYTAKLCDSFFGKNESISGKQILNLSNIQQVNLFAIKNLYEQWKIDAEQFKSPYFNFDSPEVKQALQNFMNTVSQHILVKKSDFTSVLEKATKDTLMLIFYPQSYFNDTIRDLPNFTLTQDAISQISKFIQINKSVPVALEDKLNGQTFVYVNEALHWLEDICQNVSFESTEKYAAIFSEKVVLDKTLFENQKRSFDFQPLVPDTTPAQNKMAEPVASFFDSKIIDEPAVSMSQKMILTPILEIEEPVDLPPTNPSQQEIRLNDKFKTERSLNDQTATNSTISDVHQHAAIAGIHSGISLNQKFIFINYLFKGETSAYNHAIDELELCKDFEEGKELILRKYVNRYNWDLTSFETEEFLDVLKRRFS